MRFLLAVVLVAFVQPQVPPPGGTKPAAGAPQTPATPTQGPYEFTSEMGAFLFVVKSEKSASFDAAMAKLKQALLQSKVATRKQQAAGWRVLKSTETPTDGTITYLFLIDPVVKGASYDPVDILRESLPNDVQGAFGQLKESWVSATRIGLRELLKMGGS